MLWQSCDEIQEGGERVPAAWSTPIMKNYGRIAQRRLYFGGAEIDAAETYSRV